MLSGLPTRYFFDARVLSDPQTPADEKSRWVNEGNIARKKISDEWEEADVPPGARVLPAKVVLTKKPLHDDAEVDPEGQRRELWCAWS